MKTTWFMGLALIGLTACGPLQEGSRLAETASNVLARAGIVEIDSPAFVDTSGLTRAQIDAQGGELLRISIIDAGRTTLFAKLGENAQKTTWVSSDDISVALDGGILIGTRGLGDDLMGADASGVRASLRRGGNHARILDFLNGLGQIERHSYQCSTVATGSETITIYERNYATTILEETCTGPQAEFKNTYWRDSNGIVWQSRQWISDGAGYLGYQRL